MQPELKRIKNIHACLKQRCLNPKNKDYKYYGGRGITFPEKWKTFAGFYEDMQEGYSPDLTIDRINTEGNYSKENCRWVTQAEQKKNRKYRFSGYKWEASLKKKRNQKIILLRNKGFTLQEIADKCKITRERVRQVSKRGF